VSVRRLWARFEELPFRHGMALLGGALALAGLLVAGVLASGGGSREPAAATPVRPPGNGPVQAAAPPAPTWGAYVPPRRTRPAVPAPPVRPVAPSSTPRPRVTHASPTPSVVCPSTLKKWPWAWEACKRKQGR
jgi:hypothetical protein